MTTIIANTEYKVTFNGSATYFLEDKNGDCYKTFSTERKAVNYFNKVSLMAGVK